MKSTARQRVLRALTDAGSRGLTTAELARPDCGGVRFGGRLKELRDAGYHIQADRVRQGSFRYFLSLPGDSLPPVEAGCDSPAAASLGWNRPSLRNTQTYADEFSYSPDGGTLRRVPHAHDTHTLPLIDDFLADLQAGREPWPVAPLERAAA